MATTRTIGALLLASSMLAVGLGAPAGAAAQARRFGAIGARANRASLVVVTGGATVLPNQVFETVVVFDGPVFVAGTVRGNVVATNGDVRVLGNVGGDVIATNGRVFLAPTARVGNNVISSAVPVVAPGAVVGGELRSETVARDWASIGYWTGHVALWAAVSFSVLLLGLLLAWIAPRAGEAVVLAGRTAVSSSIGAGLIVALAIPAAAVVAFATLFGIPLAFWLLFALGFLSVLGYTAGALFLGRLILRKQPARRAVPFLVGWLILRAVALVPFVAILAWLVVSVWGAGTIAVAIARARSGRALLVPATTPAGPPPGPPAPPAAAPTAPPTPAAA